jgi:hypothetical protein
VSKLYRQQLEGGILAVNGSRGTGGILTVNVSRGTGGILTVNVSRGTGGILTVNVPRGTGGILTVHCCGHTVSANCQQDQELTPSRSVTMWPTVQDGLKALPQDLPLAAQSWSGYLKQYSHVGGCDTAVVLAAAYRILTGWDMSTVHSATVLSATAV